MFKKKFLTAHECRCKTKTNQEKESARNAKDLKIAVENKVIQEITNCHNSATILYNMYVSGSDLEKLKIYFVDLEYNVDYGVKIGSSYRYFTVIW